MKCPFCQSDMQEEEFELKVFFVNEETSSCGCCSGSYRTYCEVEIHKWEDFGKETKYCGDVKNIKRCSNSKCRFLAMFY